jgi:hypothetical protein
MADKTQNIFVNYKFNTADVERAQQPLNKVNQLNNQIQQSAGKAGQGISQGFRQAQQSIGSMQITLQRLKTQIELSTNPASTAKLSAEYRKLKTELDAATKAAFGLTNAQKQTAQSTGSLASSFGKLYSAVQTVIGAAIVRQVAGFALEMARLAGNTEGVERAFRRAFPNSIAVLNQLRAATRGTVTDFELMQRTLQASNLGVSVEQLPELFEFAAVRAQQTGESVDYLVDSIVRGIGRKSPLILDNLGISAIRLKEKFDGAALASQSVADVTKAVAEIASEEMEKMGGFAVTAATKVDQLATAWEHLRTKVAQGTEGMTTGIVSLMSQTLEGWGKIIDLFRGNKPFLESVRLQASADALRIVQSKEYQEFAGNQQKKFDFIQQEINSRVQLIGRYNDNISALKEEREILKDKNPYDDRIDQLTRSIKGYNDNKVVIAATILALKEYLNAIDLTNKEEGKEIITIQTLREELKGLQEQREEATSIDNKPELDRLQREILLLEDRILKISDNIKWQKQWNREKEEQALSAMNAAAAEEELGKSIDFVSNKLGTAADKAPEFKDSLDEIEEAIQEVVTALPAFENAVGDVLKNQKGREFFIRLRLGIQGEGGETSEIQKFVNDQLKKLGETIYNGTLDNLHSIVDAEVDSYRQRIEATEAFYDNQIALAGDNERAKDVLRIREKRETDKLRSEMARKEKQAKRTHVLIDVAAGIAKALATYTWPYSLIPAAIVAAQGAAQLAIINRQPTNFAKGVIDLKGPGTATSDSIPANLSRGESVMTAWETKHAGDALRDIRAKKLDNNKLRQLKQGRDPVPSQALGTAEIVKAIKDQKHPDVVKTSNLIYESKKYNDEYRKRVRSASVKI